MKNKFNVIIEDNGIFRPYDILPYLEQEWGKLGSKKPSEIQKWISGELKYQFWGRCEYEIQLLRWPKGPKDIPKKIDIFWQCEMNLDIITRLFKENVGITE